MSQQNDTRFEERGIIKRIYVENFVTYDKAVIHPGRNLNVIIGPNGTGKSTIVCAIAIGLGGKPKVIGRATNVSDYIKTDCHSAKIEIELKDTGNKNIVIVRTFNKSNQTTWTLNGKSVQGKEIQELTASLNIQVDNLCQFLPQDKVQDFSKMNSQQLLENTERSVGDSKLLQYHEKLMDYRKRGKDIEETIANKSRLLDSETQKYEGMKETVGNIKERKIIKKRIRTMKQKKAWISYDISRKILSDAKTERDTAAAEMKKLDEQLKPLQKIIDQLENHIRGLKKTVEKHNSELCMRTSKVKRTLDEVPNKDREIREIEKNREHRIQSEENRDQEINAELQQKNRLDNDLKVMIEDVGTEEKLKATQQEIAKKLESQRCELEKLTDKVNALKAQEEFLNDQIRGINAEINNAKDVETKRLELLKSRNMDAYRSVMWLRNNREKFSAPIYEPMLLNIHVKEAQYSKYLENMIAFRDLMAFVCEDKSDMNLLMQCLRDEEKLQMNVVYSDPNQPLRKEPNVPLDAIRQFGFRHYLIDLIDAPESILKYLVKMYNIHNIPLGTKMVENCIDNIPASFRLFFSENNVFSVTTSKYSGTKAIRSNGVVGNGTLSIIQDTAKLHGLTAKLEKLNFDKAQVIEKMKELEVRVRQSNNQLEELRSLKQQSQRNAQTMQSLKARIHLSERKIRDLKNERTSIEEIKAAATSEIQTVLKEQLKLFAQYNSQLLNCVEFVTTNDRAKFELELQMRTIVTRKNETQDLRDRCSAAETTYKRLENELLPLRNETQKLYDLAMQSTDNINPSDKKFKPYHAAFAKLPFTIEEINAELETAQAKVYCLGDNADGEQILRNFEKAEANVKKFGEEIETMKIQATTINEKIEETKVLWLTPLQDLVDRINKNFSTHLSLMGCAGEVTLKPGDNPNDFDQYGLKIRVKFRDADELQELTRQRQSGGERAVTTAVYMIALQELSRVPFRCVDEINQGMDAINERRVFELIVQITGRSNSAQYFLLTPKLLPNLQYGEHVTVHCIYNGPFMVSCTEFDMASCIDGIAARARNQ